MQGRAADSDRLTLLLMVTSWPKSTPGYRDAMPESQLRYPDLPEPLLRIVEARHHDPFEVLGRHDQGNGNAILRLLLPRAERVRIGIS